MASADPSQPRPNARLDWSPDFSFARKPSPRGPYSPGLPSPRTAPPRRSQPGDQDPVRDTGATVLPPIRVPPSPLSPVRGRDRRRQGCLVLEVPRSKYSLPAPSSLPTPRTASTPGVPRIVTREGARSLLLSGLPEAKAARLSRSLDRRESAPFVATESPSTIHPEIIQLREHLRSLGPVYLGSASAADVLVQAVALRRNSLPTSPSDGSPVIKTEDSEDVEMTDDTKPIEDTKPVVDTKPTDDIKSPEPSSPKFSNEIHVRARVRPRQPDRRPFVLQRKFNLDELRATIPEPGSDPSSPQRRSSIADLGSPYSASPGSAGFPPAPLIGRARRRSTSAKHGPVPFSPRGRRAPGSAPQVKVPPRAPANLVPIRKLPTPLPRDHLILTFHSARDASRGYP